jgi:4'-phosphopantetheinyl transferase
MVHIADLEAMDAEILEQLLSDHERQRAERFRHAEDRRRFAVGRAMVRLLFAEELGVRPSEVELELGAAGKPRLRVGPAFSVAHAGGRVGVAVAHGAEVGLDLEPIRPVPGAFGVAARFFHPDERRELARLATGDRDAAFLTLWTRKEAYGKARGTGLPPALGEPFLPVTTSEFQCLCDRRIWSIADLPLGSSWAGAVAVAADAVHVEVACWKPR